MKPEKVFSSRLGKVFVYADRIEIVQGFWASGGDPSSTSIPLGAITAMTLKHPLMKVPYLQFGVHGSSSEDKQYRWMCKPKQGKELKDYLEERIRNVRAQAQPQQSAPSIAAEIAALAKLKSEGHLSEAEFEAGKKRILGLAS